MEYWQEWDYLEDEILVRKRRKICITCNHFRYSTTSSCVTILTCPFHQKLIPQGDHLIKGCRYWSCLLYTSPSPRDYAASRMPSSA